uniref:alpha-glucan family phosphorylase n=1 Tax=Candidatus Limisoma sp. TaxID=3076476 RepID=UPI003FED564C
MKLKVSNTNAPVWRDITIHAELPAKLKSLDELAHNVWWSWNSEARNLFQDIDPNLWLQTDENPVLLLQKLSLERCQELAKDEAFLARLNEVHKAFKDYMKKPYRKDVPSISYFSMEYGLCSALKIYSGGLGVLAGDYIKEASDSCVNLTAVGFMYRYGYFDQSLSMDGQQIAEYPAQNFNQIPVEQVLNSDGTPMVLAVPYPGRNIYCNIWRVNVGRVKLYLLDTDNNQNSEFDRPITHKLYGGDWENRIKQEYLLGIGGVMMLRALGINMKKPYRKEVPSISYFRKEYG